MKFVGFNPWKRLMLKTIVEDDNPDFKEYKILLEENGKYFIGVTDGGGDHSFEELNIVTKDEISFEEILNIISEEIENEELVNEFKRLY